MKTYQRLPRAAVGSTSYLCHRCMNERNTLINWKIGRVVRSPSMYFFTRFAAILNTDYSCMHLELLSLQPYGTLT